MHAACIDERTGVSSVLTGGQRNDAVSFETVWEGAPVLPAPVAVVMDKAYDSNAIRRFLAVREIEVVIPSKANRTEPIPHDARKDGSRAKVERFFNKLKQFRRIATRYEELGRTFLAFVHNRVRMDHTPIIRQHGLVDRPRHLSPPTGAGLPSITHSNISIS